MAEMNKIQSFKTFSELKAEEKQIKLQEEAKTKREQLATKISETLAELDVTSLEELSEEQRKQLVAKLFNEDAAEEIEDKIEDMGEPKPADEEAGDELEAEMSEGNAFIYAAAKAKAEGKSEFEFNGKSYKVTLKKDTGLKESYSFLITEATRSQFGKIDKNGNITSVYVHNDGYPEHMGGVIKNYDAKDVDKILDLGKAGISFLDNKIGDKHDFNNPKRGWSIFYGRDRGETGNMVSKGNVKNIKAYLKNVANQAGAEYVYLYDERDGKWYMADTYTDKELQVSEGLITEATRWQFGIIDKSGKIQSNYVHYDGYPSAVVPEIKKMNAAKVKKMLKDSEMGGMSSLGDFYNDSQKSTILTGEVKNIKKYLQEAGDEAGAEYVYLYDERIGKWVGADVYTDKSLKPVEQLSESVVTEGKDDFMARFGSANINLKKGYKHHTEDELNDLYDKLGDLVKTLKVKDVTLVFESEVNEAEVSSDSEFEEYAMSVLKKAFGEDFDEAKAKEVVDGLKSKYSGDYGAMVGALQSSLG